MKSLQTAEGSPAETEVLADAEGSASMEPVPQREPEPPPAASRDRSEILAVQEALRESGERLHFLIENAPAIALLTLDARGSLSSWNTSARRLFGYRPEEVIGADIEMLCEAVEVRRINEALVAAGLEGRAELECPLKRRDGRIFAAQVAILAVRDGERNPNGHVLVVIDRSERHEAGRALQAARDEALNADRESRKVRAESNAVRVLLGEVTRVMASPTSDAGKLAHIAMLLGELAVLPAREPAAAEPAAGEVRQRELGDR